MLSLKSWLNALVTTLNCPALSSRARLRACLSASTSFGYQSLIMDLIASIRLYGLFGSSDKMVKIRRVSSFVSSVVFEKQVFN